MGWLWVCHNKHVIKEQKDECSLDTANTFSVRHCDGEQTPIRSQNNSHSVCYWTAKGSSRQKQPLAGLAAPFRQPQHPPPPAVQWHTVMEKNYLSPVVVKLQISCSVCGPVWFLCTEAWIPNVAMSCLHSATAKRSESQTAHHWMLLLSSVPFASDIFIFPMEWPTWFTPSLRGGMRSLMRSRPLASSKLVILCCGENPRMAKGRKCTNKLGKHVPHTISYLIFSFFSPKPNLWLSELISKFTVGWFLLILNPWPLSVLCASECHTLLWLAHGCKTDTSKIAFVTCICARQRL